MNSCHEKKAKVFKALCDPKRIAILELLRTGEKCACKISSELHIAQSALSYHMKILCESQLVTFWYVGKWTHYQISAEGCAHAMQLLQEITTTSTAETETARCTGSAQAACA